ncbi:MAG: hypothetical protein V1903_04595 [Bacteroidota bacterium]
MRKRLTAFLSLLVILVFIGYIILDTARPAGDQPDETAADKLSGPEDQWRIAQEIFVMEGLNAVAVSEHGTLFTGGESFVKCYSNDLKEIWSIETSDKITALAVFNDTLYAATEELVLVINKEGKILVEWGPYESKCLFTSITANGSHVAVADAGNKTVFIFTKEGVVSSMIGHFDEKLIIPSPYFDVFLTPKNILYMAHTGNFRIEKRSIEGKLLSSFGEPGTEPGAFCGCCNPAHFTVTPGGFITAEKGINRIKILGTEGGFVEYVSSENDFIASVPLDIATNDDKTIYGVNPADGKLYVFRK